MPLFIPNSLHNLTTNISIQGGLRGKWATVRLYPIKEIYNKWEG